MTDNRQSDVLPGAESAWKFIRAGVPPGSIFGLLLFLIFVNDIVSYIFKKNNMTWAKLGLFILIQRKLNKPVHPPLLVDNQVITDQK